MTALSKESFVLDGVRAQLLVRDLVVASAYFVCDPLPDDRYEILVKPDRVPFVKQWLRTHLHP